MGWGLGRSKYRTSQIEVEKGKARKILWRRTLWRNADAREKKRDEDHAG
jgi:hypothetical protein